MYWFLIRTSATFSLTKFKFMFILCRETSPQTSKRSSSIIPLKGQSSNIVCTSKIHSPAMVYSQLSVFICQICNIIRASRVQSNCKLVVITITIPRRIRPNRGDSIHDGVVRDEATPLHDVIHGQATHLRDVVLGVCRICGPYRELP